MSYHFKRRHDTIKYLSGCLINKNSLYEHRWHKSCSKRSNSFHIRLIVATDTLATDPATDNTQSFHVDFKGKAPP